MDPNANLKEQLELCREIGMLENRLDAIEIEEGSDLDNVDDIDKEISEKGSRLAELVLALNNWLARGGFAPTWKEVKDG